MYKEYGGYWFYWLRDDRIIQAKSLIEEYNLLNCPQEYIGPFKNEEDAELFRTNNPNLSKEFNQFLQEYWKYCNQEIIDDEKFWDDYIQEVGYDNLY